MPPARKRLSRIAQAVCPPLPGQPSWGISGRGVLTLPCPSWPCSVPGTSAHRNLKSHPPKEAAFSSHLQWRKQAQRGVVQTARGWE